MRDRRLAIVAIFILSGALGLIYEVVWSRQLVLVFGNTTQAIALATNTLGIVIGTVGIPFLAMPTIGSPVTVLVLAVANISTAWWIWRLRPTRRRRMEVFSAPIIAAAVIAIGFAGLARDPSVVPIKRAGHLSASGEDEIASVQAGTIARQPHLWVAGTSMTAITVDARDRLWHGVQLSNRSDPWRPR